MGQEVPSFDLRFLRDKRQLDDAVTLPQRIRPLGPVPNQQPSSAAASVVPSLSPQPAGAPGPQLGHPEPSPVAALLAGMQASLSGQVGPANVGLNANLGPSGRFQGAGVRASAPVGQGQLDVNAALNNALALQGLQARYSQGPFSVSGGYNPGQGLSVGGSYQQGPFSVQAGYGPSGPSAQLGVRQAFQEGGLATSIRNNPVDHQKDVDFINTRNQRMREVAGLQPYAKGGAVWTRKEGQNPEGGLNAKARRALKAEGHDIKPPVSAEQAAKSPKAAARRKSFCARMGGTEGPMKDDKGRPTRKALALRKWDCKAEGGEVAKPVWERPRPKDLGEPSQLSVKKKAAAKRRAKAAGRKYPNLVDNMAVAREKGK